MPIVNFASKLGWHITVADGRSPLYVPNVSLKRMNFFLLAYERPQLDGPSDSAYSTRTGGCHRGAGWGYCCHPYPLLRTGPGAAESSSPRGFALFGDSWPPSPDSTVGCVHCRFDRPDSRGMHGQAARSGRAQHWFRGTSSHRSRHYCGNPGRARPIKPYR